MVLSALVSQTRFYMGAGKGDGLKNPKAQTIAMSIRKATLAYFFLAFGSTSHGFDFRSRSRVALPVRSRR